MLIESNINYRRLSKGCMPITKAGLEQAMDKIRLSSIRPPHSTPPARHLGARPNFRTKVSDLNLLTSVGVSNPNWTLEEDVSWIFDSLSKDSTSPTLSYGNYYSNDLSRIGLDSSSDSSRLCLDSTSTDQEKDLFF